VCFVICRYEVKGGLSRFFSYFVCEELCFLAVAAREENKKILVFFPPMEIKKEAPMDNCGDLTMVDGMSTLALNLSPHGGGGGGMPGDGASMDLYARHMHNIHHNGGQNGVSMTPNIVPKVEPQIKVEPTAAMARPPSSASVGSRSSYLESPSGNKRFRVDSDNGGGFNQNRWGPQPVNNNSAAAHHMNGGGVHGQTVVSPLGHPPSPSPLNNGSGYSSGGPVTPSNGFPSPMTVSSYDPYSPSAKLCKSSHPRFFF
jgi:hypothetical protein